MSVPARSVLPEILDELPPDDPRARASRRDLRRVHRAMATATLLSRALARLAEPAPRRVLELGAGDGTLLLRVARALRPAWRDVELTLLDRHDLLDRDTRAGYAALGWRVHVDCRDVREWQRAPAGRSWDLALAALFLHHFTDAELRPLLAAVAARTRAFVACEPHRGVLAHGGSRLVGLLGANRVTREDAVTSVAAGFRGRELTELWPAAGWRVAEGAAGPFTQRFVAERVAS